MASNRSAAAKKAWATRRKEGLPGAIARIKDRKLQALAIHSMKTRGGLRRTKRAGRGRAWTPGEIAFVTVGN